MRHAIFLLLALPVLVHAQRWAPTGAQWTYKQGHAGGPDTNLAVITAIGDTVVQGRDCTKLEATDGFFICFPLYDIIHYDGDSLWIYDRHDDRFMLLMCMNALPGDSWVTKLQHSAGGTRDTITWTVLDTATIVVDGIALRSLDLAYDGLVLSPYCWPHCTFIERIGNLKYLFDFQMGFCDAETFHGLRCYQDDEIFWQSPSVPLCALSTSIAELDDAHWFSLSPNPVTTGTPVQVDIPALHGGMQLVVFDGLGREVLRSDVRNERIELNLSTCGIHVVTLHRDGVPIAQQRIVVH